MPFNNLASCINNFTLKNVSFKMFFSDRNQLMPVTYNYCQLKVSVFLYGTIPFRGVCENLVCTVEYIR